MASDSNDANKNIKNLSIIALLLKFQKPNLAKIKDLKFAKSTSSGFDYLTSEAKKTFIYI